MAWQLVDEVQQHAPADLTLADRAVLLAIAAEARVEHRRATLARGELAHRAGLTPRGVRGVLRRLRDRGLEVRIPIPGRVDGLGRPVYALPGTTVTYQLPALAPGDTAPVDNSSPRGTSQDPDPVDNSTDKGDLTRPPGDSACREGGPGMPRRGPWEDPPPRSREPVGAPAPAREAPARPVDNPPASRTPAPQGAAAGPAPRLECPTHAELPPHVPRPPCRDCAQLRRAQASHRSELARAEARARRACTACDELGWALAADGQAAVPAVRCRHPDITPTRPPSRPPTSPTRERAPAPR